GKPKSPPGGGATAGWSSTIRTRDIAIGFFRMTGVSRLHAPRVSIPAFRPATLLVTRAAAGGYPRRGGWFRTAVQTFRVATAGATAAPRLAGTNVAASPATHRSVMPPRTSIGSIFALFTLLTRNTFRP